MESYEQAVKESADVNLRVFPNTNGKYHLFGNKGRVKENLTLEEIIIYVRQISNDRAIQSGFQYLLEDTEQY